MTDTLTPGSFFTIGKGSDKRSVRLVQCKYCPSVFYFDESDPDPASGKPRRKNTDGTIHFDKFPDNKAQLSKDSLSGYRFTEEEFSNEILNLEESSSSAPKEPSSPSPQSQKEITIKGDLLIIKHIERDKEGSISREYSIQRQLEKNDNSREEMIDLSNILDESL